MSLFIIEAAVIGAKEALKIALVWFAVSAFLTNRGRGGLVRYFYMAVAGATLISLFSFFVPPDIQVKEFLSKLVNYVFFVFYMGSITVLFLDRAGWGWLRGDRAAGGLLFLLSVFYFSPDIIGSSFFVRELSVMKESAAAVYGSALAGFLVSMAAGVLALWRLRGRAASLFGVGQLLIFVLVVKLVGGGIEGFSEFTLLPAVQRGAMKFIHDFIHQTFVFLLVPDHPMLKITVWNFIGIFFGPNIGLAMALGVLLLPPLVFLYRSVTAPIPVPASLETGSERRMHRAKVRAGRRLRALPVAAYIAVILALWFAGGGEQVSSLYVPAARPVVEDKGMVVVPLNDPTMDLMDGRLHKFSLLKDGETIGIMMIKKPDGKLAVCLDACEICPPEGYGQQEQEVVCIYCRTPIPIETLGRSGGCNPIPLEAEVSSVDVRISTGEIMKKWLSVKTGETKRVLGE